VRACVRVCVRACVRACVPQYQQPSSIVCNKKLETYSHRRLVHVRRFTFEAFAESNAKGPNVDLGIVWCSLDELGSHPPSRACHCRVGGFWVIEMDAVRRSICTMATANSE